MTRAKWRLLWVFACALAASFAHAEEKSAITVLPGAPAGFEDLNRPNTTNVDVSYGGSQLGPYLATFRPGFIRFDKPEEMLARIPAIKAEARSTVAKALTGEIPTHAEAICGRIHTDKCGVILPDIAGVIFDENYYRASVFINPAYLETQDLYEQKMLPEPDHHFSGVHSVNLSAVGQDVGALQYSLLGNSTLAYGPERLNFSEVFTQNSASLETASATLDKWGLESTAGFFDTRSSVLMPISHITGVSVATSLNTNLDYRRSKGNQIMLYLPQRSWVSLIYRDVIYSTDLYEAGNQIINTSALPDGAYTVTLRIRGINGDTREETRFIAKNFDIPPAGEPIYYAQGGLLRSEDQTTTLPNFTSIPILRAGMIRRVTDTTGISTDVLAVKNEAFVEPGFFELLPPNQQLRVDGLFGSRGDYGAGATYMSTFLDNRLSVSGDARAIWPSVPTSDDSNDPTDPVNLIGKQTEQLTGEIAYQINNNLSLDFNANYTTVADQPTQYAYGPQLRWYLWRQNVNNLLLTAEHSQIQGGGAEDAVMLNLTLRFGPWEMDGDVAAQHGSSDAAGGGSQGTGGGARLSWNDDQTPGQLRIVGVEDRKTTEGETYGADSDFRGRWGQLIMNAQQNNVGGESNSLYTGTLSFNIVHTGDTVAWGGDHQEASAIIGDLGGNATDTTMKMMVDGAERGAGRIGNELPVFVTPYQTYNVSLAPEANSRFVDYDGSVHTTTLYPGNVTELRWDVQKIYIVLGRLVDAKGNPVIGATLRQARNITVTGDDGRFQAELINVGELLFTREEQSPEEKAWNAGIVLHGQIAASAGRAQHTPLSPLQRQAILDIFEPSESAPPLAAALLPQTPIPKARPEQTPWAQATAVNPSVLDSLLNPNAPPEKASATPPLAAITNEPAVDTPKPDQSAAPSVGPVAAETATVQVPLNPATLPPRKSYSCKVTLPETKAVNNVLIISAPLVCNLVEDKKPGEEGKPAENEAPQQKKPG